MYIKQLLRHHFSRSLLPFDNRNNQLFCSFIFNLFLLSFCLLLLIFIPQDIKRHDQGIYRCRIDFRTSQTQSYTYNLSVISEYLSCIKRLYEEDTERVWMRICPSILLAFWELKKQADGKKMKTEKEAPEKSKNQSHYTLFCWHSKPCFYSLLWVNFKGD